MAVTASNYVQIVVQGHSILNGQQLLNVFHYRKFSTGAPAATKQEVMDAFHPVWEIIALSLSEDYEQDEYRLRNIDDPFDPYAIKTTNLHNGVVPGEPMPSLVAYVVQMKTALRGRNFRGSKHFAPISEDDTAGSSLKLGATLAKYTAAKDVLLDPLTIGLDVFEPVIYSPTLSDLTVVPHDIVSVALDAVVLNMVLGTMKRRKTGVGV